MNDIGKEGKIVCMKVFLYVCLYVCIYVCMDVFMHAFIYGVVLAPPPPPPPPPLSVACGVVTTPRPLWCGVVGLGCLTLLVPLWCGGGFWDLTPSHPLPLCGLVCCAVVVGCGFQV